MITKYIKGDITETELKYICHGVNCQNKMGSGVAKALFTKFPEVKTKFHSFSSQFRIPENRLGEVDFVECGNKTILNCFTQLNYGYDGKRYVNYGAIVKCFDFIKDNIRNETLAIPKIGCGLAGGDWNIVEQLINDTVGDDLEIWVYEL